MKYALIIGNNKYNDPKLAQLKTPAADSQALAKVLADEHFGSFNEVTPLINKTEAEIRRAISGFLSNKRPDDLVLVYFSGHGILDDRGRLFLGLKDTETSMLKATAIPSSFISDEMDSCRSKRQILILDCCHSGAYERGTKGELKAVTEATFEGSGYGRVVLTASDSTQYALEGDQVISQTELSLFTHFLLEGLRTGEADTNNDGQVTLDEWYDYTYVQVVGRTPRQIPHKWSYNQQGDLIISKNPNVKKRAVELPFELVQALESSFTTIRESAVHELGKLLDSHDPEMVNMARQALEKMRGDDSRRISSVADSLLSRFAAEIAPSDSPIIQQTTDRHYGDISEHQVPSAESEGPSFGRRLLSQLETIKLPKKAAIGLISFLGVLVLGYLIFRAMPTFSQYPVQLFVDAGNVTLYGDSGLKAPLKFFPPDETVYSLCAGDLSHGSYLIAASSNDCRANKTLGWVRASVVKKLFSGDVPSTPLSPTQLPTATLRPSPTSSLQYPVQFSVDMGNVTLYADSGLKAPVSFFPPDKTIYFLCTEDLGSNSYQVAASADNCSTNKTLGWVRASVVKKLFSGDFPHTQP